TGAAASSPPSPSATGRAQARSLRFGSATRSWRARPGGARFFHGRKGSRARSPGTPRTASGGSAASTGFPSARRCSSSHEARALRPVKILVTGGGGFLGSHLVDRLRADGEDPFVARRAEFDL